MRGTTRPYLVLKNLKTTDSATYRCRVKNKMLNIYHDIKLDVKGIITVPHFSHPFNPWQRQSNEFCIGEGRDSKKNLIFEMALKYSKWSKNIHLIFEKF